jgi:hypothetical protein
VLLLSGIILAALVLLYLVSFVIFVLHQTGEWFVPSFSVHGLTEFLTSMPWLILLISVIFIVILEILVRKYSFGYRKPLLYTSVGVLVIVLGGGALVARTSLHRGLFDFAREQHLPLAGNLYIHYGTPHSNNVAIGAITQIKTQGYEIEDRRDREYYVMVTGGTSFPDGNNFVVGDSIVVFGSRGDDNSIQAVGIRRVMGTEPPPPLQHQSIYGN